MFENGKDRKISLKYLFFIGMFLGAVAFCVVYGVRILDFTNTGWLFYGDNDLRQHYIAWCHYRNDSWAFPIGLIESLSYPNSVSVIYTDSIPLFAVFFKLFAKYLPVTFQYFGLFGLLSFMLMGALATVLLARFTDNDVICILGSLFYVLSFQVLQRMYYHTALAAQWIIILAIVLWVYDSKINGTVKKSIIWGAMGFLCVGIHSYYLPMVGFVLAALMLQQFFIDTKTKNSIVMAAVTPCAEFVAFCVCGVFNLWILGGFYGGAGASGWGLGSFGANLNTFINPIDYGRLLPRLPLFYDFQYEGFGYLGCGVLYMFAIVAIGIVFRKIRKVPEEAFHSSKIYGRLVLIVFAVSVLMSTLPLLSFNDKKIIWIKYPAIVEKILGIFRSNGRFIWVAVYLLITAAISFVAYTFRQYRSVAVIVVALALVLQITDESKMIADKHSYFRADYQIVTIWDLPEVKALADGKSDFIFLYNTNDITLFSAYYGYLHGIRQNNYYYARDIDDKINAQIDEYLAELKSGVIREDAVYIINDEVYAADYEFYNELAKDMRYQYVDGHYIFTK